MQPKVSVVLCTYNRSDLLRKAIASVLSQGYKEYELVIIDDGSVDGSREVVEEFKDDRIRYIWQINAGLSTARNVGIAHSLGSLIAFLDDDDCLTVDSIGVRVAAFELAPVLGWVSGGYETVDESEKVTSVNRQWIRHPDLGIATWLRWCPTCPSAVMVRREWLDKVQGFDIEQGLQEDWDLWLRLARSGCEMGWVRQTVCRYLIHPTNMTRNSKAMHASDGLLRVLDKFYQTNAEAHDLTPLRNAAYANAYMKLATAAFGSHDVDLALRDIEMAVQLDPQLALNHREAVMEFLLGYARSPLIDRPMDHARFVLDNLPQQEYSLKSRRKKALGKVAAGLFFSAAEMDDHDAVLGVMPVMMRHDLTWLLNLGVWSITTRAIRRSMVSGVNPKKPVES